MKFTAKKDSRKRQQYDKFELDRLNLRVLLLETKNLQSTVGLDIYKNLAKVRINNRCILTSRAKAVSSFFKLSRMSFKDKASFGYLEGVSRSSW